MKSAMSAVPTIGNLPHDEDLIPFSTSKDLIASCTRLGPSILYFGPGFDEELATLRTLFESLDLLTVSANPEGVPLGLVLGFDLVSGRPKLLVNLTQARKQGVAFQPEVLKLMKVVA
jgi:hypothetical protein